MKFPLADLVTPPQQKSFNELVVARPFRKKSLLVGGVRDAGV